MVFVSAVITTHNREVGLVRRAVESVMNQGWDDMELIVVDDSDAEYPGRKETEALIRSYQGRKKEVRYVQHTSCRGLAAARNTGIRESCGEFVAFLDDDDEWLCEKTGRQVEQFCRGCAGRETGLVYCGGYLMDDTAGTREIIDVRYQRGAVFELLLSGNWIGYPSFVIFRRHALEAVGGFDEQIPYMEDFDLYLRIAAEYDVDYVAQPLAVYHDHPGEQMTDDLRRYLAGVLYISRKYERELASNVRAGKKWSRELAQVRAELQGVAEE